MREWPTRMFMHQRREGERPMPLGARWDHRYLASGRL